MGKVLIAGRRSKMVAFVAILALTTFGALATASAQPADIKAIDKAFQDHYARGNYPTAQIDAQELGRLHDLEAVKEDSCKTVTFDP
jgi:hypothetical protein